MTSICFLKLPKNLANQFSRARPVVSAPHDIPALTFFVGVANSRIESAVALYDEALAFPCHRFCLP